MVKYYTDVREETHTQDSRKLEDRNDRDVEKIRRILEGSFDQDTVAHVCPKVIRDRPNIDHDFILDFVQSVCHLEGAVC